MAIVELQIRTASFCTLVRNLINSRTLPAPKQESLPGLQGKFLERIECTSCDFDVPSDDASGSIFWLNAELTFRYNDNLAGVRNAGSLVRGPTMDRPVPFKIKFAIDSSNPTKPALSYQLYALNSIPQSPERISIDIPKDIEARSFALKGSNEIIAFRIGTDPNDQVNDEPVDKIGEGDWIELVPGGFVAEKVRTLLDKAIGDAVAPPPPPDPNKPWLPLPKPNELKREDATIAWWARQDDSVVIATGGIVAMNACPLFKVDVGVELKLTIQIEFPNPKSMKTTAILTWDADSTWCDVWFTLLTGVPVGIAVHIGAEAAASETVLGKSISPGDGFKQISKTSDSVTLQKIGSPPSPPTVDFECLHSEVTDDGFQTGGPIKPKGVYPLLGGVVIPAQAGWHIDCNLRSVTTVFNPAQVILTNYTKDYFGPPPIVFIDETIFDPAGAWAIATNMANMLDPHSSSPQTVLTFTDPKSGRLPAGTQTSVFLFTDCGVRWVDLGIIPAVPARPPEFARGLMNSYCDSLNNPWGKGVTQMGWDTDILVDPDYAHIEGMDPVRLWTVGLAQLPITARIEFLAIAPDGRERSIGILEGQESAALQLVTDANEILAMRSDQDFSAPRPTLLRSWMFPTSSQEIGFRPTSMASINGSIAASDGNQANRVFHPRDTDSENQSEGRTSGAATPDFTLYDRQISRQAEIGLPAWGTLARVNKNTVATLHRGRLLIGAISGQNRVQ